MTQHTDDKQMKDDFELFERACGGVLPTLATARLEADLVASPRRLAMTYVASAILGYLASLAICAQCSIGLSPMAWKTAALLHTIPDPWCALVCGMLFGIAPFIAAAMILSRFQHRYLIYQMWWLPVAVPLVGSIVMTLLGSKRELSWHALWIGAAIATPYLAEAVMGWLLRQRRWKSSTERAARSSRRA